MGKGPPRRCQRAVLVPRPNAIASGASSRSKVLARMPDPALRSSKMTGRGSRAAKLPFPSRGSPNLLPPPPPARRHFVRSRCDTDTIVGPDLTGKAQNPHATGSRLPAPYSPQGSGPTYAYPTNSRIPFAPHSLALGLQSRRRRSYRLQRAARMRAYRAFASPHLLPAPAYRRHRARGEARERSQRSLVPEGGALACGVPGVRCVLRHPCIRASACSVLVPSK